MLPALLALAALGALPVQAPPDEEQEAARELAQLEELVRKGRPRRAHEGYSDLAREHPDTRAGRTAARRALPSAYLGAVDVLRHGPSENRIDVAILPEGYQIRELKGFAKLAADVPDVFRRQPTFAEYFEYLDFVRGDCVSADNGVDGFGREYDTALGAHVIGTIQGHVAIDPAAVHEVLEEMPATDGIAIVFVKQGVLGTGGGGIATIGGRDMSTMIHEMGHAFAGLGDEYSSQTHERGAVRRSPNVSDTPDPERVPWAHWIAAGVKGIGAYEGAAGQVHGAWRPTAKGCVMSSGDRFCPVCRERLVLSIYERVDPIDGCSPAPQPVFSDDSLELGAGLDFEVRTLRPKNHAIEVRFWVLSEAQAPRSGVQHERTGRSSERYGTPRGAGRSLRGPLPSIPGEPLRVSTDKKGVHRLHLEPGDLAPGRWRVIARARDPGVVRREVWVLRDERDLLQSERAWWVRVE